MNFIKRLSSVHLSIRFILHTDDETDGFFKNSRQKKGRKKGRPSLVDSHHIRDYVLYIAGRMV